MQLSSQMSRKADRLDVLAVAAVNPSRNIWPPSNFNIIRSATVYFVRIQYIWSWTVLMYDDGCWQMTWLTMSSNKGRPTAVCRPIVLPLLLHFYFIDISENFRRISAEKLHSRNLAENYKPRQNTANPNISRIFGWAGFIFLKSARKSSTGCLVSSIGVLYDCTRPTGDHKVSVSARSSTRPSTNVHVRAPYAITDHWYR